MTEPPPSPPSAMPAWDCRLSGSWESRSAASGPSGAGPGLSDTVPAIGARTVSAATVRRATSTAARVCTRCAAESAVTASERLPRPAASWAAARSALARAASYCDCDTRKADSAWARTRRSGMARADRRARSNARWAVASACAAPLRVTGAPPAEPAAAACWSAARAWRSARRADGDSTRSSTSPRRTCSPSRTRTCATTPSAAALAVAVARAATVAGASTTSVTVARSAAATRTPGESSPLHADSSSTTATSPALAAPTRVVTGSS